MVHLQGYSSNLDSRGFWFVNIWLILHVSKNLITISTTQGVFGFQTYDIIPHDSQKNRIIISPTQEVFGLQIYDIILHDSQKILSSFLLLVRI